MILLLPALLYGQDDPDACPQFNRCHDEHDPALDRKPCPGCKRTAIRGEDAFCSACARRERVCRHCGRPRGGGPGRTEDGARKSSEPEAGNIRRYLTYLASDELQGRLAGYPGNDRAAEYIRDHVKGWGLKPGNGDSYFQPFTVQGKKTRNVVAKIEGSGKGNEYVILGAHYDHVGMAGQADPGRMGTRSGDPNDRIWNGADDNASGTSTLMEIARVAVRGKIRFRRTVVFIWFSGEEWGLLGSKHYCRNPIYPLERTIGMVCMDMIGRNADKPITIKGCASSPAWESIVTRAAKASGLRYTIEPRATGSTDYLSFIRAGVPAIDFFSGLHADYHRRSDHADKIDFERCERVARTALNILADLANRDGKIRFKRPPRR